MSEKKDRPRDTATDYLYGITYELQRPPEGNSDGS
jgi:hypothetical protein